MIQPEELRIGNICINDVQGNLEECTIIGIKPDFVGYDGKTRIGSCIPKNLHPVPLTEDWLIKFGFIKLDVTDPFFIHSDFMSVKISLDLKMIAFNNLNLHAIKFEFVHQLQNLFFALTGQELSDNS